MRNPRLASQARTELDEIWDYIYQQTGNTDTARRVVSSITRRFALLALNPHIGRRRDHDLRAGLRSFAVDNYVILYRIENEQVVIVHVFHGSRDIARLV